MERELFWRQRSRADWEKRQRGSASDFETEINSGRKFEEDEERESETRWRRMEASTDGQIERSRKSGRRMEKQRFSIPLLMGKVPAFKRVFR